MTRTLPLLLLLILGCSAQAATLNQFTVSADVDPTTMAPKGSAETFSAGVREIWATAFIEGAPAGTRVGTRWLRKEGEGGRVVTENVVAAEGTRYVAFRIASKAEAGLPVGEYQVQFYLNGEAAGFANFTIAAAAAKQAPGGGECMARLRQWADPLQGKAVDAETRKWLEQFARYRDPKGRFEVLLPGRWFPADVSDPNTAVYVSENTGGDPIASIVVKVFSYRQQPGYGAIEAAREMRDRLVAEARQRGAKITEDSDKSNKSLGWGLRGLGFHYPVGQKQVIDATSIWAVGGQLFVLTAFAEAGAMQRLQRTYTLVHSTLLPLNACDGSPALPAR